MLRPHWPRAAPVTGAGPASVLAGVVALLMGCAQAALDARQVEPPLNPQVSLVFGYIDMSEAPSDLGWMELRQIAPRTDTPYYNMRIHEGIFYMEKFPPGLFELGEFGGRRWDGKHFAYSLPRQSPALRVAIEEPALYFMGSFTYRATSRGGSRSGRFEIASADTPAEAQLLEKLLPFTTNTPWEARLRKRLAELQ